METSLPFRPERSKVSAHCLAAGPCVCSHLLQQEAPSMMAMQETDLHVQ